jgi:hypothetical protein
MLQRVINSWCLGALQQGFVLEFIFVCAQALIVPIVILFDVIMG